MSTNPVIIFDGPDGTGKTTQAILLGHYLQTARDEKVAYCSLPVYEFPFGKVIGRGLKRWGKDESIKFPSPEDMEVLFTLNRLEILPHLVALQNEGYTLLLNRSPFANLFGVARRVLEDNIDWNNLSKREKTAMVKKVLDLDTIFLNKLEEGSGGSVSNLFLFLGTVDSMRLAEEKAKRSLGVSSDEHERRSDLQVLTRQLFKEVAQGEIPGYGATAVRGFVGRDDSSDQIWEGIYKTAVEVGKAVEHISDGFSSQDYSRVAETSRNLFETDGLREPPTFDFRRIIEREKIEIREDFGVFIDEYIRENPSVREAIETSRRIDEGQISVSGERERR